MSKIIQDNEKLHTREIIQLKLLVVEEGKAEGEWVELPESEFSNFNEYIDKKYYIERVWSNCGLILKGDICYSYDNDENCIIDMSETLKYLNKLIIDLNNISTVEEVQAFAEYGRCWDSILEIRGAILAGEYHFFANISLEDLVRIELNLPPNFLTGSLEEIILLQKKFNKMVEDYRLNGYLETTTGVMYWVNENKNR